MIALTLCGASAVQIPASRAQETTAEETAAATEEEKPYHIAADGTVDWPTFSGFRRFNSTCFVCHGPDGAGSSFAPALVESLKHMSYEQFTDIVVNGKTEVNTANQRKMPSFGTDPNVMCYLDDIYAYLKARSDGALGRGRPPKHADKPPEAAEAENACMGN
ncbi:MAG TPA: c-type cytochrome, methanol metabolism-related [Dongiaceae bacterium]|nr:c-type cytochrome, methanol metabolism-related [Dongiaceae bacterium]